MPFSFVVVLTRRLRCTDDIRADLDEYVELHCQELLEGIDRRLANAETAIQQRGGERALVFMFVSSSLNQP